MPLCRLAASRRNKFSLCIPVYLCAPRGSGASPLPQRTQRITRGNLQAIVSSTSSQFPTPGAEGMPLFRLAASRRNTFSLCIPVYLCVPCGSGFSSSPRLQRFLQLHTARRLQQYDIPIVSLTRQPLARFLRRRDEFRFHTRFARRFHHLLRQAPHAEQEFKFTSCNVTPELPMQLFACGAEFQHLASDNNPPPRRHRRQSIHRSHKRLRT